MSHRICLCLLAVFTAAVLAGATDAAAQVRLKDVARLEGARTVPLIGYGLVVGLNKTGDRRQTLFSAQSLANMLLKFGVVVPGEQIKIENVAAVLVTAELPPYTKAGGRIDVLVSSAGDARSLQGGTLLATPLQGPDGTMRVLAQGPLSIGGFGGGRGGNSLQVNHLTAGRVPSGGIVQIGHPDAPVPSGTLRLLLNEPDFTTATRLAAAINGDLGPEVAQAVDAGTVRLQVPGQHAASLAGLMARLEPLALDVDRLARVVINERTGTVVVNADVRVLQAAVAHGNLSVRISTSYDVSQPAAFSRVGQTVVTPNQRVDVTEEGNRLVALEQNTTLQEVVEALNSLGATPRDIIAIMQALKAAGALTAELVIM